MKHLILIAFIIIAGMRFKVSKSGQAYHRLPNGQICYIYKMPDGTWAVAGNCVLCLTSNGDWGHICVEEQPR